MVHAARKHLSEAALDEFVRLLNKQKARCKFKQFLFLACIAGVGPGRL